MRDSGTLVPHGDCQGLWLERQADLGDAGIGSLGKASGLNLGFPGPLKDFRYTQEEV